MLLLLLLLYIESRYSGDSRLPHRYNSTYLLLLLLLLRVLSTSQPIKFPPPRRCSWITPATGIRHELSCFSFSHLLRRTEREKDTVLGREATLLYLSCRCLLPSFYSTSSHIPHTHTYIITFIPTTPSTAATTTIGFFIASDLVASPFCHPHTHAHLHHHHITSQRTGCVLPKHSN